MKKKSKYYKGGFAEEVWNFTFLKVVGGKIKYIMFCQKWNFLYFYLLSILILSITFRLSFFLPNSKNVLVTGNLRKADKTRIGNLRKILLFSLHNLLKTSSIMCFTWPMHAQWTSCQFSEIFCLDSFPCFHQTIQLGWEVFLRIKL